MNAVTQAPRFETSSGAPLVLDSMRIHGTIENALAIFELTQIYRNQESTNIEAVYTFPLPVESVLLNLSVTLNEKHLVGRVIERAKAEAEYEEALDAGNTAVMLEQVEPGLYTMNVGNLLAGERAEVRMRYALPLRWDQGKLRIALPTTVAPRYGNALEAGVQPHQVPNTQLLVENTYELSLKVMGTLSGAEITSPSHRIAIERSASEASITLADKRTFADRDFVLTFTATDRIPSSLTLATDGDAHIAHACFHIPDHTSHQKIALKILVDCSGSMAGDSMELAKAGAVHALTLLTADDRYTASAFGDGVEHDPCCAGDFTPGEFAPALAVSSRFLRKLDANLGGTRLLPALQAVFALGANGGGRERPASEVLLITDGESWDHRAIVDAARAAGHRIFVVGVGAGPNEALVRGIAEATGGAAAFVSPNENILPVIERHIQRMRTRLSQAKIDMPGEVLWQVPARLDSSIFAGDTLQVFCSYKPEGDAKSSLALTYADGTPANINANLDVPEAATAIDASDLVRIGIAARVQESLSHGLNSEEFQLSVLAVQYQIMCSLTNYILVHQRGEDAPATTPALHLVPQMLTAGWGATGRVKSSTNAPSLRIAAGFFETRVADYQIGDNLNWDVVDSPSDEHQSTRAVYSRPMGHDTIKFCAKDRGPTPRELVERLNANCSLLRPGQGVVRKLDDASGLGTNQLDQTVLNGLRQLVQTGWREEHVVAAFWLAFLSTAVDPRFSRAHRRAILWVARNDPPPDSLLQWITEALGSTTDEAWQWQPGRAIPIPAAPGTLPQTM